jgi:hypothetical protein
VIAFFKYNVYILSIAVVFFGTSMSVSALTTTPSSSGGTAPAYCTDTNARVYSCVSLQNNGFCGDGEKPDSNCNSACPITGGVLYCYKDVVAQTGGGNTTNALSNQQGGSTTTGGGNSSDTCGAEFVPKAGVCFPKNTGLSESSILDILGAFFSWLLMVFGFLAIGAFIISGVQYLLSAGDDDMIKTAKRNMTWSIVGVIVGLSGYVIMQAIASALNANPYF